MEPTIISYHVKNISISEQCPGGVRLDLPGGKILQAGRTGAITPTYYSEHESALIRFVAKNILEIRPVYSGGKVSADVAAPTVPSVLNEMRAEVAQVEAAREGKIEKECSRIQGKKKG